VSYNLYEAGSLFHNTMCTLPYYVLDIRLMMTTCGRNMWLSLSLIRKVVF